MRIVTTYVCIYLSYYLSIYPTIYLSICQGLMEEKVNQMTEEGPDKASSAGGVSSELVGSRNSLIASLRVAGEDSLEKQIKKVE